MLNDYTSSHKICCLDWICVFETSFLRTPLHLGYIWFHIACISDEAISVISIAIETKRICRIHFAQGSCGFSVQF